MWNLAKELTSRRNLTADVSVKILFQLSNNIVSGDDSAKKGAQLSLIRKKVTLIKNQKKQLRSRYDQCISSKYVPVSRQ